MNSSDFSLLQDYVAGRLQDDARAELEFRLRKDPVLADRLIEIAADEMVIREWAACQPKVADVSRPKRMRQGTRRWLIAVTVAVACLIVSVATFWMLNQDAREPLATVVAASSAWNVDGANSPPKPLRIGMQLFAESRVTTQPEGRAELQLDDGSRLTLAADTNLELSHRDSFRHITIDCRRGTLLADVQPQGGKSSFVVSTPQAEVHVRGTRFVTTVDDNGSLVDLEIGTLDVIRKQDRQSLTLHAGQSVVVAEGVVFSPVDQESRDNIFVTPLADGFTNRHHPQQNFGTERVLRASASCVSYLKFEMPAVDFPVQAELQLHVRNSDGHGVNFNLAGSHWEEEKLTARHHPALHRESLVQLKRVGEGLLTVDVSSIAHHAGTVTIVVIGESKRGLEFFSRESDRPPTITIRRQVAHHRPHD